jgi:hypothetical protein
MQLLGEWLSRSPIWAIALFIFVGMALSASAGMALRRRHDQTETANKKETDTKEEDHHEFMVSSVMGLLALLIGFTFALAIDRFDTRRGRVLVEANAIGTTYLRAQMLDEPHRARMSKLLIDYTDNRIELGQANPGPVQRELLARNDALITDLWTATVAAFPTMKSYDFSSSFLETMNLVIDMDAARKAARKSHVPSAVFLALFGYQFIAAGAIGYKLVGRRGRQYTAILFLIFGVSLLLIIDIDRPTTGGITESQEAMLDLQASLKAQPPEIFDRFNVPAPSPAPSQ